MSIHSNYKPKERGFTIIETLVAITVLMIAIAGPLSIAGKGLTDALYSRDQMIASYLAQETMEIVKNTRDNNVAGAVAVSWTYAGPSGLTDLLVCTSSYKCDAAVLNSGSYFMANCSSNGCPLYLDNGSDGYKDSGTSKTIFTRYFYLSTPGTPTAACLSPDECDVTVIVTWNEGTVPNQVVLSSEITSTTR